MTDGKKILIVDDDKFLVDMYSLKLKNAGFDVQACLSVADALDALKKGFTPDAVLFDLVMPETDGFAFVEAMRDGNFATKAVKIALTNQSNDSEIQKASELGVDRYIVKASMIPSEVVAAVGEEIAKRGS